LKRNQSPLSSIYFNLRPLAVCYNYRMKPSALQFFALTVFCAYAAVPTNASELDKSTDVRLSVGKERVFNLTYRPETSAIQVSDPQVVTYTTIFIGAAVEISLLPLKLGSATVIIPSKDHQSKLTLSVNVRGPEDFKTDFPIVENQLVNQSTEKSLQTLQVQLSLGHETLINLSSPVSHGAGIQIGNPKVLKVQLQIFKKTGGDKYKLLLSPLQVGETSITLRNPDGKLFGRLDVQVGK